MDTEQSEKAEGHGHLFLGTPKDGYETEDSNSLVHAHEGLDLHRHYRSDTYYPIGGKGPLMYKYTSDYELPALVETY